MWFHWLLKIKNWKQPFACFQFPSQIEFWKQFGFSPHFELPNKFFSLKNSKLFLKTENKGKKQLPNIPLGFLFFFSFVFPFGLWRGDWSLQLNCWVYIFWTKLLFFFLLVGWLGGLMVYNFKGAQAFCKGAQVLFFKKINLLKKKKNLGERDRDPTCVCPWPCETNRKTKTKQD